MLFARQIILSMGLKVKLPMLLEMDNKGGKDIINSWAVGGRTRHIDVRMFFLRELKEEGILKCNWISTDDNSSDLFTKNLDGPTFLREVSHKGRVLEVGTYCGLTDGRPYNGRD